MQIGLTAGTFVNSQRQCASPCIRPGPAIVTRYTLIEAPGGVVSWHFSRSAIAVFGAVFVGEQIDGGLGERAGRRRHKSAPAS
jgi:hypothetical protein